ncbi:hypothetical protein F4814DRAFT_456176 [Daldinia grandis]|nr:hypothetical protein F4814DRAFT_456176 [Daldinia grandis]
MADHRKERPKNHSSSTSGKPRKSTHPRLLHPRVPQVSSNGHRTLENDAKGLSGYRNGSNRRHGSSRNTDTPNTQGSVDIAGGQLTATSTDVLTLFEDESLTPRPSIDTHAVSPTTLHEEDDVGTVAYKPTVNICDSQLRGGSSYFHSISGASLLYPTSNTSTTISINNVMRGSYQTGPSLTRTYMSSTSLSSNADPYSQLEPRIWNGNPTLDRHGTPIAYSPPPLDIPNNRSDRTWMSSESSRLHNPYTQYKGTHPVSNDSGDPPHTRRWSTENYQGSTAGDSADQATQEDGATRVYEDNEGSEDNEFRGNAIKGYINSEGPWIYRYNTRSG